jgi:biotin carboxyl carrier protein
MKMEEKRALVEKRLKVEEREQKREKKLKERIMKNEEKAKRLEEKKAKSLKGKHISHTDISGNEQNFEILQIFPDARKYKTTYTTKYRNRKVWKKPDLQEIKSVIPGVVTSFTVKEGDHVQKGEELMIYEAMKMQNIILAPFDGTVEKILVKEREKLAKGVIMIYLTSDAKFETDEDTTSISPDLSE